MEDHSKLEDLLFKLNEVKKILIKTPIIND